MEESNGSWGDIRMVGLATDDSEKPSSQPARLLVWPRQAFNELENGKLKNEINFLSQKQDLHSEVWCRNWSFRGREIQ